LFQAESLSDTALDSVAFGGRRRMFARHQESQPCLAAFAPRQVEGIASEAAPGSASKQALEFSAASQAALGIQSEALARRGYNPRRRRPRARRLRNTLRPPGVLLRTRKP
jgi:hypothetical protein